MINLVCSASLIELVGVAVTLETFIRDLIGSHLCRDTRFPDSGSS
jgi:hypothetical protein